LYGIANKTKTKTKSEESRLKTSKVVKKGGKKLTQNLKKAGLSAGLFFSKSRPKFEKRREKVVVIFEKKA
jgi:hypothetical protein